MLNRFSSRRHAIGESFLNDRLYQARSYDRIAGYFSSSILEVAGEAIESMQGVVRIVCNSDLDVRDVATAKAAHIALQREWRQKSEHFYGEPGKPRFAKLYELLVSGKMEIKVLPSSCFGLIHGKAGVITPADGRKTAFLGSANETYSAWKLNYEIVWEDDAEESVLWVQQEFNALWNHPQAVRLTDVANIVQDIHRISQREVISVDQWITAPDPASAVIESPAYRREFGLWAHQKYFVQLAFEAHVSGIGARYVLADMVGLGKTIQLALAAQLMALHGEKPVLIIAPKTLIWQWQGEMDSLLDMPSAVWDGRQWVDENGYKYPVAGPEGIKNCPRRVGIVSQGLLTRKGAVSAHLLNKAYECVIVDECHRARRRNLRPDGENDPPEPNNLMLFLQQIAPKTKSLLLATATPVQLYPIEAYDLLDILSRGNDHVLGNMFSIWRRDKRRTLNLILGRELPPQKFDEIWEWIRNPLPSSAENPQLFEPLRRRMELVETDAVLEGSRINRIAPQDKHRISRMAAEFFQQHNPFIRHIVRRTRSFLESTLDPETHEPYLKPVKVRLFGEGEEEAIPLPGYLDDAYKAAEEFCQALGQRMRSAGFLRTMLLRRIGSSIEAGKNTAIKMIGDTRPEDLAEEDDDAPEEEQEADQPALASKLSEPEKAILRRLVSHLEKHRDRDPKYAQLHAYLLDKGWLDLGCIIFSQYYDTIQYMAYQLTADLPDEPIGIYAGGMKSGILRRGKYTTVSKEAIKAQVQRGELRVLFGTDAASEGLNLQRLGTLINLDLPWNPTRLEQRKGRIQRIGQLREEVFVYNMRYKDSVEDRVHQMLSSRLEHIFDLFGQIPDVLEDVWVELAIGNKEKAKAIINALPEQHPFEMKYNRIEQVDWEGCTEVLNDIERRGRLLEGW
jgi:superfamily II DNA or RNA helicase